MRSFSLLVTIILSSHLLFGQLGDFKLTDALKSGANDVYGTYCGFAGTPPQARKAVEKMIQNRNIVGLVTWLDSPNLVKKTYAAEAFIRLSTEINMTAELSAKVDKVRVRQDLISTCQGCILDKLTIAECIAQIKPGQELDAPHDQTSAPRY